MASSGKDRIRCQLELGEADQSGVWPDYLQYVFTETDIPALLDLVADQTFDQMDSESTEVWAPLHAWRTLGQLGSNQPFFHCSTSSTGSALNWVSVRNEPHPNRTTQNFMESIRRIFRRNRTMTI